MAKYRIVRDKSRIFRWEVHKRFFYLFWVTVGWSNSLEECEKIIRQCSYKAYYNSAGEKI